MIVSTSQAHAHITGSHDKLLFHRPLQTSKVHVIISTSLAHARIIGSHDQLLFHRLLQTSFVHMISSCFTSSSAHNWLIRSFTVAQAPTSNIYSHDQLLFHRLLHA